MALCLLTQPRQQQQQQHWRRHLQVAGSTFHSLGPTSDSDSDSDSDSAGHNLRPVTGGGTRPQSPRRLQRGKGVRVEVVPPNHRRAASLVRDGRGL